MLKNTELYASPTEISWEILSQTASTQRSNVSLDTNEIVWEIKCYSTNRITVDELVKHVSYIVDTNPSERVVRILINTIESGPLPIVYLVRQVQDWIASRKTELPVCRVGIVTRDNNISTPVLEVLLRQLRLKRVQIRFFSKKTATDAFEWVRVK